MFWRKQASREKAVGGTDFHDVLEQLEDNASELDRYWDEQHDRYVLQKLLDEISAEFSPKTIAAFERFAIAGEPVESVAETLEMSAGAIYVAKSRVSRRLRAEAEGLVDCDEIS